MKDKGYGFLIPLVSVLVGAYWLYASVATYGIYSRSGPDTGFYPAIVASGLIAIGLILLLTGGRGEPTGFKPLQLLPVAGILGVVALGYFIGTLPALFVFLVVWIKWVARYPAKTALLVSCVATFVVWLVFRYAVSVHFQTGVLFEGFLN